MAIGLSGGIVGFPVALWRLGRLFRAIGNRLLLYSPNNGWM